MIAVPRILDIVTGTRLNVFHIDEEMFEVSAANYAEINQIEMPTDPLIPTILDYDELVSSKFMSL